MAFSRLRSLLKPLSCALLASAAALCPAPASAGSPFLFTPEASVAEASPAYRYANMTNEEAMAELDRRKILYLKVAHAPGVRAPIRLTGRLNGVNFHSVLPPEQRVTSLFEILDARLALALDDFAAVLARHDIDEVVHYTMYRPNVPMRDHAPHDDGEDKDHGHDVRLAKRPARAGKKAPGSTGKAAPVAIGKKGVLDGAPKASGERPRRMKEKGAAEAGPKEKSAAKAGPKAKGTAEAGSKEKGAAEAGSKAKASGAAGRPKQAATARSKPAKAAGKAGARRVARRKDIAPARSTASSARRSDAGQKPRGAWAPPGTRHPAGLAIDIGALKKRDGTWLSIARHFQGRIGDKTCGAGAPQPELPEARELRSIVCEAADLGIFTYALTPNYDAPHADHYHMEIKPGVRWFLYH
ncbi:extensin family protein [Sorangium sp. So ce1036]|uniref:extensin family protein n=1 Tax=Sorangium sp. So ce1036 TaxID=3133328 RepID=UPI003F00FF93